MPLLSVIMASKNENILYLEKCIDSILNQTFNDYNFYIITEETDSNYKYFNDLTSKYRKIKLLNNLKHPGVSTARNLGIQNSQSKYIAIIDSDDYYDATKFEKQVEFLEKNDQISLVGSNILLVDSKDNIIGERLYPQNPDKIRKQFLYEMSVANPSIVVRRQDIDEVGLFDKNFNKAEDFELWLRFLASNKKLFNLQESLVYYRTTPDANQKRGRTHYKNYYFALKRHGKFIWPLAIRVIPISVFFIIQLMPNKLLSILLNMKIVHAIKGINIKVKKRNHDYFKNSIQG